MKTTILLLFSFSFAMFAGGELSYRDAVRQEKAHCEQGFSIEIKMPAYCGKYKTGEVK